MKQVLLPFLCLQLSGAILAQSSSSLTISKPPIDTSVFGKWPSVEVPNLTTDARYAMFIIKNQPPGSRTLVLRSMNEPWRKEFIGAKSGTFTSDNQKALFLSAKDSLCITTLISRQEEYIANVSAYRLIKQGSAEWLVYQLKGAAKQMVVRNVATGTEKPYEGVLSYLFSEDAGVLLLQREVKDQANISIQQVSWISFPEGGSREIWQGAGARGFVFDKTGSQLAFTVSDKQGNNTIWHYRAGTEKAALLATNESQGIDSNLVLEGVSYHGFTKDGSRLFIDLKEKPYPKPKPGAVMVDVWSYTDVKLQSQQLEELKNINNYLACIELSTGKIIRLEQEGDYVAIPEQWQELALVSHTKGDIPERYWNHESQSNTYIVSIKSGNRKEVQLDIVDGISSVSPSGRYIIGKGKKDKSNYYCFDVISGKLLNITNCISGFGDVKYDTDVSDLKSHFKSLKFEAWVPNESGVLIYDKYDIWLVDAIGQKQAVNLTNGYGRKHHIIFRILEAYNGKIPTETNKLILNSFDRTNKNEGIYELQLSTVGTPKLLINGAFKLQIPSTIINFNSLLSGNFSALLMQRESTDNSPNYYLTDYFQRFNKVTEVFPERNFNWLTAELHTWKSLNGRLVQGVLYKPENFDSTQRYPVLIHYYQNMSDEIYKYKAPKPTLDFINIPWFVSNGYLVFTPDIYYENGKPGESACNSVVSAAKYLNGKKWVNPTKIGLQGQSFGGYETNYVVTHSNLFAAAMSSSGASDLISLYNGLNIGGRSKQTFLEISQYRMRSTLWGRPDLYISNSPIFNAHQVNTPLLMMNNKKDQGVPFMQGLEFFTALRRLGKKVWMLQYDDGGHTVRYTNDAVQHTIRITQFFDHYLKGILPPKWMTRGIPAKMKGIDDGLELDYEIKTPGNGLLLMEKENKRNLRVLN